MQPTPPCWPTTRRGLHPFCQHRRRSQAGDASAGSRKRLLRTLAPDDELTERGMEAAQIKEMVRARYGGIAEAAGDSSIHCMRFKSPRPNRPHDIEQESRFVGSRT